MIILHHVWKKCLCGLETIFITKPCIIYDSKIHGEHLETMISYPNMVPDINENTRLPSTTLAWTNGQDLTAE